MGQNQAVATALKADGGIGFPNLDAQGNLLVNTGGVPAAVTNVANTSGDVAAAAAVATLPGAVGKTTYISGFAITGAGATGAAQVLAALTGTIAELDYVVNVPAGATVGLTPLVVNFNPPLPASAANTAIVLTLPSLGTGNLHTCVSAWGFQE